MYDFDCVSHWTAVAKANIGKPLELNRRIGVVGGKKKNLEAARFWPPHGLILTPTVPDGNIYSGYTSRA